MLPNPVKNNVSILSEELLIDNYEILSLNGSLLRTSAVNLSKTFNISVADLPAGVLILKLFTKDGQIVSKRITKI